MISVVYCTRNSNPEHQEHLIKSSGLHKNLEIIEIINNGESLTKAYNRGLKMAKNNIVVFCHDDIIVETNQWGNKLLKLFSNNLEFGIIGVAGTKYMSETGRWWDDFKKMYGRVKHTHEGKTWQSNYSDDLGDFIEETVIVDGLFFAIDKTKIKNLFDESFDGFHFYDVSFCFQNYLNNVKIGVTTKIRVNHKSIGMTNDEWESNRQKFVEKYGDNLPVKIKRILRKNEKLKILIGCLSFSNFTGSELYVLELAKGLIKKGHDVTICSNVENPLASIAKSYGIKLANIQEPPGFKAGDGVWKLKTQQGEVTSEPNTLYKISNVDFDILHLNHKPITEHLLKFYPNTDTVCTIHSEVLSLEEPVINPQIKKYIAIRPEIKEYIVDSFGIDKDMVDVIYNPIDENKFKPSNHIEKRNKKRTLFVGTIDYLRKNAIIDLIDETRKNNEELWVVGKNNGDYLESVVLNHEHVKYFEPTNNVEKFIHQCDETAGILLGRTTIEGWMCGKGGWIYDVDNEGNIKSKNFYNVPDDIDKFKSSTVIDNIIKSYSEIIS